MKIIHSLIAGIGFPSAIVGSAFAQGLSCGDVYANAVIDVDISTSENTEKSFYFNLYCEESGDMKSFASDGSVAFPIKGLPVSMSGGADMSQEKMKEFCRIGAGEDYSAQADFDYARYANEAALRSYNDCRALEQERVMVTHRTAPPEGFTVFIEFRGVNQEGTLDLVDYDTDKMTCTTQFVGDDEVTTLSGSMSRVIGSDNISIGCTRRAEVHEGQDFYPGATFRMSTSWGPYNITLPPNTRLGYDLVAEAEAAHAEILADLGAARQEAASWKERSDRLTRRTNGARLYRVYQGDNFSVGADFKQLCPQQGGRRIDATYLDEACRTKGIRYWGHSTAMSYGGGICGHTMHVVLCAPPS